MQAALTRISATHVVIAHRLSSIRDVDRIYVLDDRRIVESGGYDDLSARDGVFAALARRELVQKPAQLHAATVSNPVDRAPPHEPTLPS